MILELCQVRILPKLPAFRKQSLCKLLLAWLQRANTIALPRVADNQRGDYALSVFLPAEPVLPVPGSAEAAEPVLPAPGSAEAAEPVLPVPGSAEAAEPALPAPTAATWLSLQQPAAAAAGSAQATAESPRAACCSSKSSPAPGLPGTLKKRRPIESAGRIHCPFSRCQPDCSKRVRLAASRHSHSRFHNLRFWRNRTRTASTASCSSCLISLGQSLSLASPAPSDCDDDEDDEDEEEEEAALRAWPTMSGPRTFTIEFRGPNKGAKGPTCKTAGEHRSGRNSVETPAPAFLSCNFGASMAPGHFLV